MSSGGAEATTPQNPQEEQAVGFSTEDLCKEKKTKKEPWLL